MSGSSTSANVITFIGARVAGAPTYVPAHLPNGAQKPIRQMASVNIYQNIGGSASKFKITAWGKMADIVARSCATGKELTLICEAHSYQGKVVIPGAPGQQLNFVTMADGTPLLTEKIGFVIRTIHFGPDSDKTIDQEIQAGIRPAYWNVNGHQDREAWINVCKQRNATQFVPGNTWFGYAQVRMPQGQLVDPNSFGRQEAAPVNTGVNTGTAYVAPVPGFGGVVNNGWGGNTAKVAPVAAPNAQWGGTPVNVHGQNMGYAMPNHPAQNNGFAM